MKNRRPVNATNARLPVGATLSYDDNNTQMQPLTQLSQAAAARPRVHIPEAVMAEGVLMATEGKVSTKNAWDVRVIEGMEDAVASTLANSNADDEYLTFSRMANVVESGAKVWTHRVDNTYQLSLQMVRRVLRTEGKDETEEGNQENAEDGDSQRPQQRRRRLERTIADSIDEINAEKRPGEDRISDVSNPLFRAITKRYDQGHARGLLLHNAPLGVMGNMVLDVDYSRADYNSEELQAMLDRRDERVAAFSVDVKPATDAAGRLSSGAAAPAIQALMTSATNRAPSEAPSMQARAQSQAAAVAASQPRSDNGDGGDNDWGDWGADMDYDDGPSGEGDAAPEAAAIAREIADGSWEMSRVGHAISEAIGSTEDSWVAFSQEAANAVTQRGNLGILASRNLSSIRRQCQAIEATEQNAGKKRPRAEKKAVTFLTEEDLLSEEAIREALKLNPTNATALLPLGKELLGLAPGERKLSEYGHNHNYCNQRAREHGLVVDHPTRAVLPWWMPLDAKNVRAFYQPFSTDNPHWGQLRRTRHTQAAREVARYDTDGENMYVSDMPTDVFDDGMDDYDDGGGDDDDAGGARPSGLFNLAAAEPMQETARFSGLFDGAVPENAIPLLEGPEVLNVLRVAQATMPTQVDVVRLRELMWQKVQEEANFDAETGKSCVAVPDDEDAEERGLSNINDARFSRIVSSLLPEIRRVSKDGTLSPAFFFFAILFLANEHRILLQNDPNDVADLFIKGLAPLMAS